MRHCQNTNSETQHEPVLLNEYDTNATGETVSAKFFQLRKSQSAVCTSALSSGMRSNLVSCMLCMLREEDSLLAVVVLQEGDEI